MPSACVARPSSLTGQGRHRTRNPSVFHVKQASRLPGPSSLPVSDPTPMITLPGLTQRGRPRRRRHSPVRHAGQSHVMARRRCRSARLHPRVDDVLAAPRRSPMCRTIARRGSRAADPFSRARRLATRTPRRLRRFLIEGAIPAHEGTGARRTPGFTDPVTSVRVAHPEVRPTRSALGRAPRRDPSAGAGAAGIEGTAVSGKDHSIVTTRTKRLRSSVRRPCADSWYDDHALGPFRRIRSDRR